VVGAGDAAAHGLDENVPERAVEDEIVALVGGPLGLLLGGTSWRRIPVNLALSTKVSTMNGSTPYRLAQFSLKRFQV
jgi:hypothetical protein